MQEIISSTPTPKRKTRRSYSKEFEASIAVQCNAGEKSIAQIALEHQINANLIHKWCRELKRSSQQRMVPVALNPTTVDQPEIGSRIEVVLGAATIRFYGSVDQRSVHAVLSCLR